MRKQWRAVLGAACWLAVAAGCAPGDPAQEIPGFVFRASITPAGAAPGAYSASLLVVAPAGNRARYRVREQLVRVDLPGKTVGETDVLTGAIVVDSEGRVISDLSMIVVDATRSRSGSLRRDVFVGERVLETERHPTIELRPTGIRGLPSPLTRPTSWRVDARFSGGRVTGTASTGLAFGDYGLVRPRRALVAGVADTITLEYEFALVPSAPSGA